MSQGAATSSVTWKIGRYDVVGHLASGGMAEILLGRLLGPSGFQRPVVIKRILPHLVREKGFVDMFLDEARIVAGIRHANVVQVHELGHDADNLFLVMEFLEGESCSGLAKRLRAVGEALDPALAAFIVAEACAGLHAAHELKDPAGALRNVVHRDVSPQNVFVTYGGQVKVLDFGIATAADRVTRTETGTFKGKFEYSSPEQCKGKKLDRRSDVFALGILLFELSTGTRLFKRSGQLDTLRAICEEPVVSPKTVVPTYPDALERIIMRALARDKDQRYPTALAMRHELLAAVRQISDHVAPEEELGALMHKLFAERIAEKATLLERVEKGSTVDNIPAVETDTSIEIPMAVDSPSVPPPGGGTLRMSVTGEPTSQASGERPVLFAPDESSVVVPKRSIGFVAVGGGLAALAIIGLVIALVARGKPAAEPTEPSASATASATAAPVASPAPSPTVSAAPAAPAEVVVHLETTPAKAKVLVNGQERGTTPLDLRLPRSTDAVTVELRKDGYQAQTEKVVADGDQKLKLTLTPVAKGAPPPAPAPANNPYKRFD